jgi:hypothetical protein
MLYGLATIRVSDGQCARYRERQGQGDAELFWSGLSITGGYDEAAKLKKVDANFAALVNFQPTEHAGACHP